jgi:hypothetical protein
MRKLLLIAGVAALAAPSLAIAQDITPDPTAPSATTSGADVAYTGGPNDLMAREARLDRAIHDGARSGEISHEDAMHDRDLLAAVRTRQDAMAADHGALTPDDRMFLSRELDGVNTRLKLQMGGAF